MSASDQQCDIQDRDTYRGLAKVLLWLLERHLDDNGRAGLNFFFFFFFFFFLGCAAVSH